MCYFSSGRLIFSFSGPTSLLSLHYLQPPIWNIKIQEFHMLNILRVRMCGNWGHISIRSTSHPYCSYYLESCSNKYPFLPTWVDPYLWASILWSQHWIFCIEDVHWSACNLLRNSFRSAVRWVQFGLCCTTQKWNWIGSVPARCNWPCSIIKLIAYT